MTPLSTLLLCLPAVLVLIVCVAGVAGLSLPAARPATSPRRSRQRYVSGREKTT